MHCIEFGQRMQELLDCRQRPEIDDELLEHATCCPECCGLLRGQQFLFSGLPDLDPPCLRIDFAEQTVRAAITRRRMRRFVPLLATATIAASVALLVAIRPGTTPSDQPAVASSDVKSDSPKGPTTGVKQSQLQAADSRINPEPYRELIQGLFTQMNRIPQLEPVDQITGSIRPLTSTFNTAIDILWRGTLAGGTGTETQESRVQFRRDTSISRWGLRLVHDLT